MNRDLLDHRPLRCYTINNSLLSTREKVLEPVQRSVINTNALKFREKNRVGDGIDLAEVNEYTVKNRM